MGLLLCAGLANTEDCAVVVAEFGLAATSERSFFMPVARVLAFSLLTLSLLVASVAPARAQTYTIRACWEDLALDFEPMEIGHLGLSGPSINRCVSHDWGIQSEGYPMSGLWYRGDAFGWLLKAPPRTTITGFSAEVSGHSGYGSAVIPAPWFRGFWDPDGSDEWRSENEPWQWNAVSAAGLSAKRLAFGLRCTATVCEFPFPPGGVPVGDNDQLARARDIVVTVEDKERPKIQLLKGIPSGWHRENVLPLSFTATDNVGVVKMSVSIDGATATDPLSRSCFSGDSNTLPWPCAAVSPPLVASLEVAGLVDGPHVVKLSATDVAGNVSSATFEILTDHEAPRAPADAGLAGSGSWQRDNRFAVQWVNPAADASAPIDGIAYQLCPAANKAFDESGCVTGQRDGSGLTRLDDLAVPAAGEWTLRLALRDAAGNVDLDRSAKLEPLRFDGTAPMGAFLPFDPMDPATVRLAATDDSSGVASVEIEARRRGSAAWQALPVSPSGEAFTAPLDDDQLEPGIYDLRARLTDRAGNERTTSNLAAGVPLTVQLPIRAMTQLSVGHPERVRVKSSKGKKPTYKRVLVAKPQADHGKPVEIEGRLTDEAGNPRPGAAVQVLERVDLPGRDFQELAVVHTDATGAFKFRAVPGPARQLRFVYPGTATTRARTEDVELQVRAGITLSPSRRTVLNGDEVVFKGRLLGGPIPAAGKLLTLQALTSRGWRTFATPRARASDGRFSAPYRFTSTPETTRYSFRVIVPKETSYPYARGASKIARVLVRGA